MSRVCILLNVSANVPVLQVYKNIQIIRKAARIKWFLADRMACETLDFSQLLESILYFSYIYN